MTTAPLPESHPIWILKNISVKGTSRARLHEISLSIPAGNTLLLGDSGAGKSTLLNLLVGIEFPTSGEILCQIPHSPTRLPLYWVPPGLGLWGHVSVEDHLLMVAPPVSANSAQARPSQPSHITEIMSGLDLLDLRSSLPDDLSQGERSRLAVARALASQAQVLILDEPLVHTSTLRQKQYWALIRHVCREYHIHLVIATHDFQVAAQDWSSVVILHEGRSYSTYGATESGMGTVSGSETPDFVSHIWNRLQKVEKW